MTHRRKGIYAALAAFGVIIAAAWVIWPGSESETLDIETAATDLGSITQIISTSGAVRALVTVDVGSQLSGQVSELYADYNTPVKAGDVIARIDPQTFEMRVRQARAELAVAEAGIDVQRAAVDRAEALLREAERTLARQKALKDQGNVSIAALDTAQANYDMARADLATAEAQLRNAEATVEQRRAALRTAEIDFERTEIRSPIDGIVIERNVSLGQTVAASLSAPLLFKIAQDLTQIQIEASVDEADIGGVKAGDPASFTVDAFPNRTFRGEVEQIRLSPTELQNVVTYTVVISASNPARILLPGMTANVEIVTGSRDNVLRVPIAALRLRVPQAWEAAASAAPSFGQGGAGGGAARLLDRLPEDVTAEQKAAIQKDLRAIFAEARSNGNGGFGGGDAAALRERIEARVTALLQRHLTDDQLKAFQAAAGSDERATVARLWVLDADGGPEQRTVRLGISDTNYAEVLGGDLAEGDRIIVRVRQREDS